MAYYHGLISSRRANSLLTSKQDGSFLLRDSQSQPGNFVLSTKCGGRMFHVLIFQKDGKYNLDSPLDQNEEPINFDNLDELITFLVGHELKVDEYEIHLQDVVLCDDNPQQRARFSSNVAGRGGNDFEDNDLLTDMFATLFGTHCVVICTAQSKLSFDGKPVEGKQFLAVIVKDGKQKGFFIRLVDTERKCMIGEKKVGKDFQYDLPGDLVMTYISEHGITCIGFRDAHGKDQFLHQIDRIVKLHQDRAVKLRGKLEPEARAPPLSPTEVSHRLKASNFDIDNMSTEWQYLFDQAGVSRAMLEDRSTLQFILDTVHEIGGEPLTLDISKQNGAIGAQVNGSGSPSESLKRERMQALELDDNIKRETMRASMLSQELVKQSLKKSPLKSRHICSYLALCERFKDQLVIKHSLIAISPETAVCVCETCAAGKSIVQIAGSPPQQFTLPVGWCQFIHRSQMHTLAQCFSYRWHVAYCCIPKSRVASIFRTGQLLHSHSSGTVLLSPDISCACRVASITPEKYHDKVTDQHFKVYTVFQVYIQPGTYSVQIADNPGAMSDSPLQTQLEWHVPERTYIIHSLLLQLQPVP